MTPELLELLKSVDTPTVCNAIEVAQGKRGFSNFTRATVLVSDAKAKAIVGYAATAQIAAVEPPTEDPEVIKTRRMAYYKHMADAPEPSLVVIEDLDYPNAIGAYWGEVNTNVHKAFGMSGALTNGVMRDLDDMADDFPVIAGSIGPSHGFVHVRTVGKPVKLFGMTVHNGDLVHADKHGAVVVPADIIPKLEQAIMKMIATEKFILDPAKAGPMTFEDFEAAWAKFEAART